MELLSENRCAPASRVPGTARSSGIRAGIVSSSKPNWEGAPVIRMLVAAPGSALLTRSRQSAITPRRAATCPTCHRSVGDSTENRRTPPSTATSSSSVVLPGPVRSTSEPSKPAANAAFSSPVELISASAPPSRSARAISGCGLALKE